ncbi:hypothetical protein ACJ73_07771 [Blastomyces percursus]|uniref:Uncharacterized protein n=1 Tax=Blastomyces percursus TaxID=1658174 RepID=A0A1J9PX14_9EURO|nr:hypothetical protein ACJ73_07771 [Blastomyces percursus]
MTYYHKPRGKRFSDITKPERPRKKRQKTSFSGGPRVGQGPDPDTVSALERAYPNQELGDILLSSDHNHIRVVPPQFAAAVRLIAAIEPSHQTSDLIKPLLKRIYCYALAKIHPKGQRVENVESVIMSKIHQYLRLGRSWNTIVERARSIASRILAREISETEVTGILCVLKTGSVWERAPVEACCAALSALYAKTGTYQHINTFSPYVNSALCRITGMTHKFVLYSNGGIVRLDPMSRCLHTASSTASHWKESSMAAVSEALSESREDHSESAGLLCVLLCFLAELEVPLQLCVRGSTPRKRWNNRGDIEVMNALDAGLVPELVQALSHHTDLDNALRELRSFSAVSSKSGSTCSLDPSVSARILRSLPLEFHSFWRKQALIVAFRSIPWKYLEPRPLNMELFLRHLKHTVHKARDCDGFQGLAPNIRIDLILTLAEASRFPDMVWKRFVIDQAKELLCGLNDEYLQSCIAERESVVYRDSMKIFPLKIMHGESAHTEAFVHSMVVTHSRFPGCKSDRRP